MVNIETIRKKMQDRQAVLTIAAAILLLLSLIPLFVIGRYNVMSADDYAVGKGVKAVWDNSHNFLLVLQYAFSHMMHMYMTWQGSYSYDFLASLNPGVFNNRMLVMVPIIMLLSVCTAVWLLVKYVIGKFFEVERKDYNIIILMVSFLIIQTVPSPVEAFFWYDGAMHYILLHSIMLVFISIMMCLDGGIKTNNRILLLIFAAFLAFITGGSQYITALEAVLIYAVYIAQDYKNITWKKIIPGFFLIAGFCMNVMAPGNFVRRDAGKGYGAVKAIVFSFRYALQYGKRWISPLFVAVCLFLLPVIWHIIKQKKKKYRFSHPMIVLLGSFCLFASCFTPALYGVGNVDAGRIQNVILIMFYIIMFFDLFYVAGWLYTKVENKSGEFFTDIGRCLDILKKYTGCYLAVMFGVIVLVFIGTGDKNTFSSMSALRSLVKGEAKVFYQEEQERLQTYLDESQPIAYIKPHSAKPKVLFFTDVVPEGDANYWINENIAEYYGKEKVVLIVE